MPDLRTEFERQLDGLIGELGTYMDLNPVQPRQRKDYMAIRGKLRDVSRYLLNRSYGCPSGTHSGRCTCTETQKGGCIR